MTQWYIYVNGTMQAGMVEAEDRLAAVEAWLLKNPGEHDGLVWALSHIPYNPRTRRNASRSPVERILVDKDKGETNEPTH